MVERALAARLRHMQKTARMWGSPQELECAAQHLTHVWLAARATAHTFEQTLGLWTALGAPFAGDEAEHAAMRARLWGEDEERARVQVVTGFVAVWAGLERDEAREACAGPWIEALLEGPGQVGTPDRLNMALFALIGFVAREPARFVAALSQERLRTGGHELRPLPVVAPPGPGEASVSFAATFSSWARVVEGLEQVLRQLEAPVV